MLLKVFSACKPLKFFYMPSELLDPLWLSKDAVCVYEILTDGIVADTGVHLNQHDIVWTNDG
jgi:hypothetical protein